jgi:UDP-2,3-diacylglucosamine hydrolase
MMATRKRRVEVLDMVRVLPLPDGLGSTLPSWVSDPTSVSTSALPVLVASDAHLGAAPSNQERAFLTWLDRAGASASWIILNGDLFDFWFEYRAGPSRGYATVLTALRRIVDSGVPVTLVGGNHDWWGGPYLRNEIGVEFLQEPVVREIGGRRTLLAHGDGLGRGDIGYRLLKTVLRGRATRFAFGILPPGVGDRVARSVSRTGYKWDTYTEGHLARSAALESWAVETLRSQKELELVVLGHTHVPLLERIGPNQWYANSGDWVVHRSYLQLTRGCDPVLIHWEG